jgi:hypothetical protein
MTFENSFQREFPQVSGRRRERNRNPRHSPVAYLVAGSLIAVWGAGMLLDNLGLGDLGRYMHRVWPAVLVIVGITLLIHRDSNPNRYGFWGVACLLAGAWASISQQGWIHVSLAALLWPALVMLIGGSFVHRALRHK